MRMLIGILLLLSAGVVWATDWTGFTFDENTVAQHEGLIATCASTFGEDALVREVTQLHLESQGASGLDVARIHEFAAAWLVNACENQDCTDPVVQVAVCASLTSYAIVPF
jgi:hypothetical protein